MKSATRWSLLGAVILTGAGLWQLLRARPIVVETGVVAQRPLAVTVAEDGETRVRWRHAVSVPTTGRFEPTHCEEGDPVRRGEVVGRLYPAPLDTRQRSQAVARLNAALSAEAAAGAQLGAAAAAASDARRTMERLTNLAERAPVAAEELDRARTATEAADRRHDAARFYARQMAYESQAAEAALAAEFDSVGPSLALRAPVSGTVLRVLEECSRVVPAGTVVLEIGDLRTLEIVVDVLSEDAVRIRPGAVMWVAAGSDDSLRARVRAIEPSGFRKVSPLGVEEQRVNVIGDFAEPPRAIGDRYRVEARIVVWDTASTLTVTAAALFRRGDDWAVFVQQQGRAQLALVQAGHRGESLVEVRSGLAAGDTVILQPGDRLRDGARTRAGP